MSKRLVIIIVIVALLLVGAVYLVYLRSHDASSATSQKIQTSYQTITLPSMLHQTAASFSGGQWTYTYQSSADRTTTYSDLVTALQAAGYTTGGQTGEFIFTTGGSLVLAVTLNPATQSSPLQSVQIQARNH